MIYLDHAATTPLDPGVLAAMSTFLGAEFGNASSLSRGGRAARTAIEDSRARLAAHLGCRPQEIVFTSGGTESDNLALRGVALARGPQCHLITTQVEHHAVLHTVDALERRGWPVTRLEADEFGRITPGQVEAALRPTTGLVSVMHANNEVGSLQPIAEIGRLLRARGVLFHTDAVQTAGLLPIRVRDIPCDLLSLSAHKLYGPKGVGLLYRRMGVELEPVLTGGDQEFGLRAGTENVAGIAALAAAVDLAVCRMSDGEAERLRILRDRLIAGILAGVRGALLTGHPTDRLPNHASFLFPGIEGETLLLELDMRGIAASSGAACASGIIEPSHVLIAMGVSALEARGSLRLTLGRGTTEADIEQVVRAVVEIVPRLRRLAAPSPTPCPTLT